MVSAVVGVEEGVPTRRSGSAARILRILGGRLLQLVIVVVFLLVGTSVLVRLTPGDPAQVILGDFASPEALAALRAQLGLDQPLWEQIAHQIRDALLLDFGTSIDQGRPVLTAILEVFPISLALMAGGILLSLVVSVPLGLLPTILRSPGLNSVISLSMVVLLAIPGFVLGLYGLLLFAVTWQVAPGGGWGTGWPDNLRYMWLPSLVLGGILIPLFTRAVQRSASDVLREEYIDAAYTRGLSRNTIVFKHVLPNVLLPLVTLVGYSAAVLVGGTIIVEALFGIPGFGSVIVLAVTTRDYPLIVGATVFGGVFVVLAGLLTDLLYAVVDPRTRSFL